MILLSVVVATRNRADYMTRCVHALSQQSMPKDQYEICVVNNGSTDNTAAAFAELKQHYPEHHLFMVEEPKAGLSRARNCGLAATSGPLVAYIDDDAVACPTWVQHYFARFTSLGEQVAIMYGDIDPEFTAPLPEWVDKHMIFYLSAHTFKPAEPHFIEQSAVECNVCYRRAPLVEAGGFPEKLGRIGNNLLSGDGAVDLVIKARGGKIFYDPMIRVRHTIHSDRINPEWFRRRFFWQGVTDYKIRVYLGEKGYNANIPLTLDMPSSQSDWSFINDKNTTENIAAVCKKLYSVGFCLAMSGILQID